MKNLFTLGILLISSLVYSQCPSGSITLADQEDIDNFVATYPDCEVIDGNLFIGSNFTFNSTPALDLSGLSSLTEVTGTLFIRKTEGVDENENVIPGSLEGLENLTSVRSLLVGRSLGFGGSLHSFESLDPLSGLSGKVDSLFIELVDIGSELPPFENLTGIGYYRQELLLGATSTPTFPNLTYLGDMTIAGGNGFFIEEDILTTVVIPSQLDSIGARQGEFNFPFGGFFIFGNNTVSEVIGGENLTYLQDVSISNNLALEDLSAFSNVNTIDFGGLSITSFVPGIFDSFQSLQSVAPGTGVNLSFFEDPEDCMDLFEELVIGVSSQVQGDEISAFPLSITTNCVENITVTGNFANLTELDIIARDATNITGFAGLDSITESRLLLVTPNISQLPEFQNLVHVEDDVLLRINFGDWLLEDLSGLSALTSVGNDLRIGFIGPAGASFFTSLTGLENLTTVGGRVEISRLEALTDASALNNLTSADELRFELLESLTNPPALNSLTSVGDIRINETGLSTLPEFASLTNMVGELRVEDNPTLPAIDGFTSLEELTGNISISGNPLLTAVSLPEELIFEGELTVMDNPSFANCGTSVSFCNLVTQASVFQLMGNGSECTVPGDVLASCLVLSATDANDRESFRVGVAEDFLTVFSNRHFENARIRLFSVDGRSVYAKQTTLVSGESRLDYPALPQGIYLIRIESEDVHFTQKLFIH